MYMDTKRLWCSAHNGQKAASNAFSGLPTKGWKNNCCSQGFTLCHDDSSRKLHSAPDDSPCALGRLPLLVIPVFQDEVVSNHLLPPFRFTLI